jgi:transmembrane sensor
MKGNGFDKNKIDNFFGEEYTKNNESYITEIFGDKSKEKELEQHLSEQFDKLIPDDNDKDLEHILYRLHYDINTKKQGSNPGRNIAFQRWVIRVAGMIILPLAIFWGFKGYLNSNAATESWVEINSPGWTRTEFSLPDGTKGWLNSNSKIKYNGNFRTDREIFLTGEAFFDVSKDKLRPFKVYANEVVIKVLGTRFNIASYEDEGEVEVVLEEGKLEFSRKDMNDDRIMNPNDLIIFDKSLNTISTEIVQPQKYISWTEGKLVFRNDPVDVIARRLGRFYDVDVYIDGQIADDIRLRGTFVDESLEQVLYYIKRSMPIDYKIMDGDIQQDETYSRKKVIISNNPNP